MTAFERGEWKRSGYRSSLRLPLIVGGGVFGFASLYAAEPRQWERVELLQGLGQIAAQAIANATLFQKLDENRRRLETVNDAALELSSTLSLREILLSTAHRLCAIASVPCCDVYMLSGESMLCVAAVVDGRVNELWEGTVVGLRDWASDKLAIDTGSTVVMSSLDDPRRNALEVEALRPFGYESQLNVPLVAKDKVIGTIELLDREAGREFSPATIATIEAVCRAAALAIDNANLFEAVQVRRRETELLNAIARRTAASLDIDEIARATAEELRQLVPFDRASVILVNDDGAMETIYSSEREIIPQRAVPIGPAQAHVLENVQRERVLFADPRTDNPMGAPHPALDGLSSTASIALIRGEELIGLLNLGSRREDAFASVDRRVFERVGTHLSLAINNARLYDEIKRMHLGNLKALSSALNAKDYYTLGHAARVAAYMVLLGHELGWPEALVQQAEEVAYLHDIGKIGVSDRILAKPSGLNDAEWELMRRHPIFSADIIRPLFSEDLVLGVRHHHEHWDGAGYPDGLTGEQIPEVARAMCVADSYDAMSFRRPYRPALTYSEALNELRRCRGAHFDPDMVDAFCRVLDRLSEQLDTARTIAAEAAALVDPAKHALLREPADEVRPEYAEIAQALRTVRDAHPPTRFITTHGRSGLNRFVIVVDAENDPDAHSELGSEVYADEELPEVFAGRRPDTNVLYVDSFGLWVTGLAPVLGDDGEVAAVVSVDLPPLGAAAAEIETLRSDVAASFASIVQTTAERLSRETLEAISDGLTGLYNHRYLHERLSEEIERAREHDSPLSLLFCDLDQFKSFNDRHGHSAGDSALRAVSRVIDGCIRRIDLAARYGGEEFAVILIDTDGAGALEVAERIRHGVSEAQLVPGRDAPLTITIGVATFPDDAVAKEELLDKSDWAMYLAKRRGRDKVMSFAAGQRAGVEEQIAYTPGQGHLALMAQLVDAKDHYAQRRSEAVAQLAAAIGRNLGLNPGAIDEAAEAARHCDIGILGVPEDILNKPATLTDAEWALIREHPVTGEKLYRGLGGDERIALAIAHHHERFDGAGYPAGLKGAAIPLTARVVATAAAYQSMVTHRPYRTRRSEEEALGELRRCAGSQFDPEIVEALSKALSPASAGSRAPA